MSGESGSSGEAALGEADTSSKKICRKYNYLFHPQSFSKFSNNVVNDCIIN